MAYQEKVESACALIREYNDALKGTLPENSSISIDIDKFKAQVVQCGAFREEHLKSFSHENVTAMLIASFNEDASLGDPVILAKEIAKIWRGKIEVDESRPVSKVKADRMTARELVESFDSSEPDSPIGERLKRIAKSQPFIVYKKGTRQLDIEATIKLLMEVKEGFSGRKDYEVENEVRKVYRVGEMPDNTADANPIWHNRPLRPDGTCDQTGRSWDGVPLEVRQFIAIAVQVGDLKADVDSAHNALDMALRDSAMADLQKRYRKAATEFNEQKDLGELPALKIKLGQAAGGLLDNGRKVAPSFRESRLVRDPLRNVPRSGSRLESRLDSK